MKFLHVVPKGRRHQISVPCLNNASSAKRQMSNEIDKTNRNVFIRSKPLWTARCGCVFTVVSLTVQWLRSILHWDSHFQCKWETTIRSNFDQSSCQQIWNQILSLIWAYVLLLFQYKSLEPQRHWSILEIICVSLVMWDMAILSLYKLDGLFFYLHLRRIT